MENTFDIRDGVLYRYNGNEKKVTVPEGVTEIGEAFIYNNTVAEIELPATLKTLDAWCFRDCDKLEKITVSKDDPYMVQTDHIIYSRDKSVLLLYPPYMEASCFEVPAFVREIAPFAFGTDKLEKVICNRGLIKIDHCAFSRCGALREIVLSDTVSELGMYSLFSEYRAVSLDKSSDGSITITVMDV